MRGGFRYSERFDAIFPYVLRDITMTSGVDFGEILLYKTAQGALLRSSLNTNFTDLKEMEFHIRKQAPEPTSNSTQSILKDHYARNIMLSANRPTYSNLTVPLRHKRTDSKNDPQKKYTRPRSKEATPRLTPRGPPEHARTVRFSDSHSPDLSSAGGQTSSPRGTSRPTTSLTYRSLMTERAEGIVGLKEHCAFTLSRVHSERRAVVTKKRSILDLLERCKERLDQALRIDQRGYIPKSLKEYKERKARERAERGETLRKPPPINLKKDVIREYRQDLLKKALAHGIDKDMRYVYTFGTISTTNT